MGSKKISATKLKAYNRFIEAFNKKFATKFELPAELNSPENYTATKKYIFKCKRCGFENLIEARRFIYAYEKDTNIRCKGCEEGKNAIEYKFKQAGLEKYIQIVNYTGTSKTRLKLTCKHGTVTYLYWADYYSLYRRNKKYYDRLGEWIFPNICPKCKEEYIEKIKKKEWMERFKKYETDTVKFLWDECDFSTMYSKAVLYCENHGRFETTWASLYNSSGKYSCRKCYLESLINNGYERRKWTVENFQKVLDEIHGSHIIEILEPPNIKISTNQKIKVKCVIHDFEYEAYVSNLLHGHKCRICGMESSSKKQSKYKTKIDLIRELEQNLPKDLFKEFEIPEFVGNRSQFPLPADNYVVVNCKRHGYVNTRVYSLLKGKYCPYCYGSSVEVKVLKFLREFLPEDVVIERNKRVLNGLEIDIWIPEYKIGIEIHGLFYHSLNRFNRSEWARLKTLHKRKADLADKKGITLFQLFENEIANPTKWEIWKSIIKSAFGIDQNVISAKKMEVVDLTNKNKIVEKFLNLNHLEGYTEYDYAFGLIDPKSNELYFVLTLEAVDSNNLENRIFVIDRYAPKLNYFIDDSVSKLVKFINKKLKPELLITRLNRRYISKNKNEFETSNEFFFNRVTGPNIYIFNHNMINNLENLKLIALTGIEIENIEDLILNNSFSAVYDSGSLEYVF